MSDPTRPSPLQNRVLPTGEIVATPARGTLMGNRGGALHDGARRLGRSRWRSRAWICCVLRFRGRHRKVMMPGRYTELFFLDEATALAAGHRPCAECRRADYTRFLDLWDALHGARPKAPALDAMLHPARVGRDRRQVRHIAAFATLPEGAFVRHDDRPHLVWCGALHPCTAEGYGAPAPLPGGLANVLTPAPIVALLGAGYRPIAHPLSAVARAPLDAGGEPRFNGPQNGEGRMTQRKTDRIETA